MRALTALFLSLVLALVSVSMAVARGQSSGDSVTICTDLGTETIILDANGNPQPSAPHLCPDCLSASTVFTLTDPISLPAAPDALHAEDGINPTHVLPSLPAPAASARGPPALPV